VGGDYRADTLKRTVSELDKLDITALQQVTWNNGGSQPADNYTIFHGSKNANNYLVWQAFSYI
jgi:hypothetical protein